MSFLFISGCVAWQNASNPFQNLEEQNPKFIVIPRFNSLAKLGTSWKKGIQCFFLAKSIYTYTGDLSIHVFFL